MTISHVQGADGNNSSGGSVASLAVSFSSAVGAGDVVCVVFGYAGGAFGSITDDQGNSYTVLGTSTGLSGYTLGVAYSANITNAPRTVTMNGSGLTFPALILDEFSGVGGFDTDNYTTTTANSASLPSGNIAPAQSGDLLYAAGWAFSSASIAIGSPWTSLENAGSFANILSAWQVQASAGSVGASFSPGNGSDKGFAAILALKPAGTTITGDAFVASELRVTAQADRAAPLEFLSLQHKDAAVPTEALSLTTSDSVLPLEWQGGLLVVAGALCSLAIVGRLLADLVFLLQWNAGATALVGAESTLVLELLASDFCAARAALEELGSADAESGINTAVQATAAAQPGVPSEAIGLAVTLIDAYLALETSSRCPADAALAGEAVLAARADDTAPTELRTAPLQQLASGRLLISPGRRRLLTGWAFDRADD